MCCKFIKSQRNLKLKVRTVFQNIWGEYKNHTIPIYRVLPYPVIVKSSTPPPPPPPPRPWAICRPLLLDFPPLCFICTYSELDLGVPHSINTQIPSHLCVEAYSDCTFLDCHIYYYLSYIATNTSSVDAKPFLGIYSCYCYSL